MKRIFLLCFAALVVAACSAASVEEGHSVPPASEDALGHDLIVLGEQLEDPYSVENVARALRLIRTVMSASFPPTGRSWMNSFPSALR